MGGGLEQTLCFDPLPGEMSHHDPKFWRRAYDPRVPDRNPSAHVRGREDEGLPGCSKGTGFKVPGPQPPPRPHEQCPAGDNPGSVLHLWPQTEPRKAISFAMSGSFSAASLQGTGAALTGQMPPGTSNPLTGSVKWGQLTGTFASPNNNPENQPHRLSTGNYSENPNSTYATTLKRSSSCPHRGGPPSLCYRTNVFDNTKPGLPMGWRSGKWGASRRPNTGAFGS
eukprot:gnl/TRDRNA2_/TRDRNA2_182310_c0_seq1.p1 gnl/TRDRNA2_/TRDRNA2_182310_c0~~gnl/TRDRNA2_/TRDRNA2_182310_c0_seq1.p1  ORF type:complete len:259 (+),score=10.71 gnl/TRDRNA2_/TRDRNA2_182310_c0_seq1:104-778(+)